MCPPSPTVNDSVSIHYIAGVARVSQPGILTAAGETGGKE